MWDHWSTTKCYWQSDKLKENWHSGYLKLSPGCSRTGFTFDIYSTSAKMWQNGNPKSQKSGNLLSTMESSQRKNICLTCSVSGPSECFNMLSCLSSTFLWSVIQTCIVFLIPSQVWLYWGRPPLKCDPHNRETHGPASKLLLVDNHIAIFFLQTRKDDVWKSSGCPKRSNPPAALMKTYKLRFILRKGWRQNGNSFVPLFLPNCHFSSSRCRNYALKKFKVLSFFNLRYHGRKYRQMWKL